MKSICRNTLKMSVAGLFVLTACATPGSIAVDKPMARKVSEYNLVQVQVADSEANHADVAGAFGQVLVKMLGEKKIAPRVVLVEGSPKSEGLLLHLDMTGYKKGNALLRFMNLWGDTEVRFAAELKDARSQEVLSRFDVKGSSLRTSSVQVGIGNVVFDTALLHAFDDLTQRAINAAAVEVVKFLKKNA